MQSVMAHRLSKAGISFLRKLYDVRNAFHYFTFESIEAHLRSKHIEYAYTILRQHVYEHVCQVQPCDRLLLRLLGGGVPRGASTASDMFNEVHLGFYLAVP